MSDETKQPQPQPQPQIVEDISQVPRLRTVSDLMASVEDEINAVKSGELKPETARLVMRGRALQFKGVELFLSAARLIPQQGKKIVQALMLPEAQAPAPAPVPGKEESKS